MRTRISAHPGADRRRLADCRAWGLAVPLLVAGALAAGCGSTHAGGGTSGPGAAAASASAVPTVTGGPVAAGGAACAGWPAGLSSATLTASFAPVSVERCVNGAQAVPGKGLWTTATLQRSASGLSSLVNALHQPAATHKPGTACPDFAVIPPQIVLINAAGQKVIPRIPASGCGQPASQVLAALNSLRWQPVSVRLIAPVPGASPAPSGTAPGPAITPGGPMKPAPAGATAPGSAPTAGGVVQPGGPMQPAGTAKAGGAVHPG